MMWETLMCFVFVFPTKALQIPAKPSQWRLVVQSTAAPTSVTDIGWKWRFQPLQLKPMLKQLVGINLESIWTKRIRVQKRSKKIKKDDSEELHEELPLKTSEVLSEGSARIHHSEDVCCCLDF